MGHDSVHPVTISAAHPTTFFQDFNQCYQKTTVFFFFSRIPRPPQYFLKMPGLSRIWSTWLFNHFSMRGPNLKNHVKLMILVKNNLQNNLPGLLMLCLGLSYTTKEVGDR